MTTENYKKAQALANKISDYASTSISESFYNIAYNEIGCLLQTIQKTETFAAKVATTIWNGMSNRSSIVARISSKQAWILATCIIDNNINFDL